jgi:hypothetical protein
MVRGVGSISCHSQAQKSAWLGRDWMGRNGIDRSRTMMPATLPTTSSRATSNGRFIDVRQRNVPLRSRGNRRHFLPAVNKKRKRRACSAAPASELELPKALQRSMRLLSSADRVEWHSDHRVEKETEKVKEMNGEENNFSQIHFGDVPKGFSLIAAYLRVTPHDLSEQKRIHFEISNDGFDYMEAAFVACTGKSSFGLFRYLNAPARKYTAVVIRADTEKLSEDVNDALEILGVDSSEVISFHPDFKFEPYSAWRQDDNGNKFMIGEYVCRSDAANAVVKWKANGYKQTCWLKKAD